MCPEIIKNRSILKVSGNDSESFLQGLITNDVSRAKTELIYTALLSPKGKYLFDFFITSHSDGYLIDISSNNAYQFIQRLNLYKLRADVTPETGIELIIDETYILEANFEKLSGVDFRKGCYVGQEVTARMKHKVELKKGFVKVQIDGSAPIGTDIISNDKVVGQIFTQSNGMAIAYLRFNRVSNDMKAGTAKIIYHELT